MAGLERRTPIRIPAAEGLTIQSLETRLLEQLQRDNERLGMDFQPLKAQGLAAASGTTPFDVLFLLLSMFIIGAALMLIWLLFRLGIEQRAGEIGTLLALGWTRRQVGWLLLAEGVLVAALGQAIGVAGGVGYAWLMLAGLRTWWIGAISSPFLTLYVTPTSLIAGFVAGLVVSALTIWISVRGLRHVALRQLMAGETAAAQIPKSKVQGRATWRSVAWAGLLAAAVGLSFLATQLGGEAQAGAFLGSAHRAGGDPAVRCRPTARSESPISAVVCRRRPRGTGGTQCRAKRRPKYRDNCAGWRRPPF